MSTIHIQLQVRGIVAVNYDEARGFAYDELSIPAMTDNLLHDILRSLLSQNDEGVDNPWRYVFLRTCRVAKETDGTYTVTLP